MTLRPAVLLLALVAASASAQEPTLPTGPVSQGMAYYTFAEPGAPTVEVLFFGEGIRNGIYKLQRGTSLVEALALAGGTPRSDSTIVAVTVVTLRVLRGGPGEARVIYETRPERLLMERDRQPTLEDGDVIEMEVETDPVPPPDEPFTFRDGLEITSRVASLASVLILLLTRL